MYIIAVYDVQQKRVNKVLKIARRYLSWIQNSVLEGELTKGQYESFIKEMTKQMNFEYDSLLIYNLGERGYLKRQEFGITKGSPSQFIWNDWRYLYLGVNQIFWLWRLLDSQETQDRST